MIDITFKDITSEEAEQLSRFYEDIKTADKEVERLRTGKTVEDKQPITFVPQQGTVPVQQKIAPPVQTVPVQAPVDSTVTQAVPTAPAVQQTVSTTAVPTTTVPEYTLDQLQAAMAPLMDAGKITELQQLVKSFGVNVLTEIPKDRYGELANGIRSLGGVL